ncbi:Serine protease Do-like HtrA [uncultured Blautia sp.]
MSNINKNTIKKMAKKGAKVTLCVALAGGLLLGGYNGISYFTEGVQNVSASSDKTTLTMTKSEKKSKEKKNTEEKKETETKGSLDVSDIAAEAMPSVVSITTKSIQEVQNYYGMFGMYGGYAPSQEEEVEGSGSGIIIGKNDEELLIATNYHVVEGADTLSVSFIDNNSYEGTVKGYEENKDLAVVSIPLEDISDDTMDQISIATIGSSDDLVVGEQVIAIGNALGYGQSVTTGIVSAKNRKMDSTSGSFSSDEDDNRNGVNLLQTDAAINPGNSGGALLNMKGEVVGINSAKLASTEVEGMGYAIAVSDVSDILENLMNEEPREKLDEGENGVLGISGRTVSEEGQVYGIPQGVFVGEVTEGGPAEEAGIKMNSIITEFAGKSVVSIDQLVNYLQYYEPGEEVEVVLQVPDGESYTEKTVTVTLGKNENKEKSESKDESADENVDESADESAQEQPSGEGNILEDWENGILSESGMQFFDGWR